eukprot:scaffold7498_cov258-Pinguiococcus_pyrenoidosus.AAC.2
MTEFKIEALDARTKKKTYWGIDEKEEEETARLEQVCVHRTIPRKWPTSTKKQTPPQARTEATAVLDRSLLKMMQGALQSEQIELAYDICRRLHLENSFTVAIRIADHEGYSAVARYLDTLRVSKFADETEEEDDDEDDEDDQDESEDDVGSDAEHGKAQRRRGRAQPQKRVNSVTPVAAGDEGNDDSDEDVAFSDDERADVSQVRSLASVNERIASGRLTEEWPCADG